VVLELSKSPEISRIVALDREPTDFSELSRPSVAAAADQDSDHHRLDDEPGPLVEAIRADLVTADLEPIMAGVTSVVHLAEERGRDVQRDNTVAVLERVLTAAADAAVGHFVLLSSALVYGAHHDNPVPISERQPLRPSSLIHAELKVELETMAQDWADEHGFRLAIIRPAVALAEDEVSWLGSALRAAMTVRTEQVDPPVQFVHHDDLASAVALVVCRGLASVYNVAAEGWIGADEFRALRGETEVRLPERVSRLRHGAAKLLADRTLLEGLEPYVTHPWVVATDKLRAEGWRPAYSNEEVYVLGTVAPLWSSLGPQKRQELALGAAGMLGAAAIGVAAWAARRVTR
jgi:nucleoside-diphosphate-sugar epimerase